MPKKSHAAKISIDVGERSVKVVKINSNGIIVRAGSAEMEPVPDGATGKEYLDRVSAAIAGAAKAARVRRGSCVLVTGGPHIIVRRFLWPEMPPDALKANAESEIVPYLPGEGEQFQISYRILNREVTVSPETGNQIARLYILVAAMTKNTAVLLRLAARRAGFSPKRIDVRENAREKLTDNKWLWMEYKLRAGKGAFMPSGSFIIMDVADALINVTVFIDNVFYANRYFSSNLGAQVLAGAAIGGYGATDGDTSGFAYALTAEISSIIDYVHYQERGSTIGGVMLFGSEEAVPGLVENLEEHLDIPVVKDLKQFDGIILSKKLVKRGKTRTSHFMDAYGAALIPDAKRRDDLNLRSEKKNRRVIFRRVLAVASLILVLSGLITAAMYYPYAQIIRLESEERYLEAELARYTVAEADLQTLRSDIDNMRRIADDISVFYYTYPSAAKTLRSLYDSLPADAGIHDVTVLDGVVSVRGTAASLAVTAQYIEALRDDGLFGDDIAHSVGNIPRNGEGSRLGFDVRPIEKTYESGAVDFELTLYVAGV